METIHTLSQLLQDSQCQYKIFDLGRRIQTIDNQQFENVEAGKQPYPFPSQRHAHIGIAYWNDNNQPWIWFLKFSLDERGLLEQAEVGNFLKYVIEAMGSRINSNMTEEQQDKLANNPYTFKPADDKMAVFHSQVRAHLNLATSQYYEHAQHYFSGGLGWANWQTVGLQGITDICARLDRDQNGLMMRKALAHIANEPLYGVLGALEHSTLPEKLALKIQELAQQQIDSQDPDLFLLSAYARALSGTSKNIYQPIIDGILASPRLSHPEVLIAIAGRTWQALSESKTAEKYLLRLAQSGNQALFNQLFADLVMLPELRMVMLPLLHSNPSQELGSALMNLQKATKS
ncbi:DUF3549 domain-containing protein [Vibrionales bacterium C3R12]|nr:DUF3549 domain-containing protein [Vibrionales bacterium C3R12]